jgi:drug/metabolite transporter (DMT)-like permease
MSFVILWIPATLAAAVTQTARNAMQSSLTARIGTVGATQVRFLYGLPFAVVFLPLVALLTGESVPAMGAESLAFVAFGAVAQIVATALMLAAMKMKSFAVTTAYIKTEPVLVAIFGVAVLGDPLSLPVAAAVVIATAGVLMVSVKPGTLAGGWAEARPALFGIAAGAGFALAAVGFRGAIQGLPEGGFLIRATTILVWGLAIQTALLVVYLAAFDRKAFLGSLAVWRVSFSAGFLGALASQFWFIGFALTSAANVRTLALVEVLMAQVVSRRVFSQAITRREIAGMALIVIGVGLLLAATAR